MEFLSRRKRLTASGFLAAVAVIGWIEYDLYSRVQELASKLEVASRGGNLVVRVMSVDHDVCEVLVNGRGTFGAYGRPQVIERIIAVGSIGEMEILPMTKPSEAMPTALMDCREGEGGTGMDMVLRKT